MKWKKYMKESQNTVNPNLSNDEKIINACMGLAGESGEVVDIIKKVYFQGHELNKDELTKEIGDVMWYVALLLRETGLDMGEVLEYNVEKLNKRYADGFSADKSINRRDK